MTNKNKVKKLIESKSWQEVQFLINESQENLELVIDIIIKNSTASQRAERIKCFWQIVSNSNFSYDYISVINRKLTSITTEKTRKSIFDLLIECPIDLIDDFVDTIINIKYLKYTHDYAVFIDKLPSVSEGVRTKLKTTLISSGNAEVIFSYAKCIKNPPIEEIRDTILRIGDVEYILKVALRFGFTKELLAEIMKSGNPMFMFIAADELKDSEETVEQAKNLVFLIDGLIEPEIKLEFAETDSIVSIEQAKNFFIAFFKKVCEFYAEDIGEWYEDEADKRNEAIENHLEIYLREDYLGYYGEIFNNKQYQSFSEFMSGEFGITKDNLSEKTM